MSDANLIDHPAISAKEDPLAIRVQLERILSDPLFKNSRRYPKLLQYVVEHTLNSSGTELKERTLGVDVFGRSPDYDTGTDPIVRITAAEVRKRLAHYYTLPGRESEIRIGIPAGSYVPEFRVPVLKPVDQAPEVVYTSPEIHPPVRKLTFLWWLIGVGSIVGVVLLVFSLTRATVSALDMFWRPVLGESDAVLLSVGQREDGPQSKRSGAPTPADQTTLTQLYYLQSENVALPDAIALARLGGLLQSKHLRYRIRAAHETSLLDFRDNPVVLVGAFTNEWNLRLNATLRFSFERNGSLFRIHDRNEPSKINWSVDFDVPYLKLTKDYALITRVVDPASDRMVVAAGGLGGYGTQASSEFLTEPSYMQKLAETAPRGWERKNIQIVLSTRVINGSSGPPEIVSAAFW